MESIYTLTIPPIPRNVIRAQLALLKSRGFGIGVYYSTVGELTYTYEYDRYLADLIKHLFPEDTVIIESPEYPIHTSYWPNNYPTALFIKDGEEHEVILNNPEDIMLSLRGILDA